MPEPPKRTISAKQILKDMQAGLDESAIKQKYKLSDKGFESVIQKLTGLGLLGESEPLLRTSPRLSEGERLEQGFSPLPDALPRGHKHEQEPESERKVAVVWRCPACGMPQDRAYEECPHCGVVVAKAAAMSPQRSWSPPPSGYRVESTASDLPARWPIVIISILALLVVGGLLLKWMSHGRHKPSFSSSVPATGAVQTFTTATFDSEVKEASKSMPVLAMFYADS